MLTASQIVADIVNEFFKRHYPENLRDSDFEYDSMFGRRYLRRRDGKGLSTISPRMECADGFTMSVQGHAGAYCLPRDDFADRYFQVEVGYPSEREDLLMPFVEDADRPTDTVYGYVPVEVVVQVIAKHGGLTKSG